MGKLHFIAEYDYTGFIFIFYRDIVMKWELEQPRDKYYVPVLTIKWLVILHLALIFVIGIMIAGAWSL